MIGFYLHRTTGAKKGTEYILPIPFSFPLRAGTGNRPAISEHREIRQIIWFIIYDSEYCRHSWQEKSFLNGTNNQEKLKCRADVPWRTNLGSPGIVFEDQHHPSGPYGPAEPTFKIGKSQIVRFSNNLSRKVDKNSVITLNERSQIMFTHNGRSWSA